MESGDIRRPHRGARRRRLGAILSLTLLTAGASAGLAAPAPRLDFTPVELDLARALAPDPGLAAFYGARGLRPIFTAPEAAAQRDALIAAVETAPAHGLPPARYDAAGLAAARDRADGATELAFAHSFSAWAHDLGGGLIADPRKIDSGIKREVLRRPLDTLLTEFAQSADPAAVLAALAPADPRYRALSEALVAQGALVVPGGVPRVAAPALRPGATGPDVTALRARLTALGIEAGAGDSYDAALTEAVAAYQEKVGLGADGVAGPRTLARLHQGAGPRARALMLSLERMRWLSGHDLRARHVWVNLPDFTARVRENGREVFATRVVIGKAEDNFRTPEFSDRMEYLVVNPRWNVPRSITVKEYLPRLQANPNAVAHLDIVDGRGKVIPRSAINFGKYTAATFPYRMQQKPSDDNALGQVKFIFPNPWNIYLHDTPTRHLFDRSVRAYSHGCIRVGRPADLAQVLLSVQSADPGAVYQKALRSGKESWLHLEPEVPVHLVYFTLLPDDDGKLHSWPDIYGRDAALWAALKKAGLASGEGER